MRHLVLPAALVAGLLLPGCLSSLTSSVQLPERRVTAFDFRAYQAEGFLFTPRPYEGPHETRGYVVLTYRASPAELVRRATQSTPSGWTVADQELAPLLAQAVATARTLGADALTELTITMRSEGSGPPTYTFAAYAIHRLPVDIEAPPPAPTPPAPDTTATDS